jgi:hypothetical protein
MNSFNEYVFRGKVDTALDTVRKILETTKHPARAADVPHVYDDKYGLVEAGEQGGARGDQQRTRGVWCEWCGARRHAQLGQSKQSDFFLFFFLLFDLTESSQSVRSNWFQRNDASL